MENSDSLTGRKRNSDKNILDISKVINERERGLEISKKDLEIERLLLKVKEQENRSKELLVILNDLKDNLEERKEKKNIFFEDERLLLIANKKKLESENGELKSRIEIMGKELIISNNKLKKFPKNKFSFFSISILSLLLIYLFIVNYRKNKKINKAKI